MAPTAAAPEAETVNEGQQTTTPTTREAEQGGEQRPPAAASAKVAVQGEPVYLCFCSKECWAAFPATFEEAMRNAM
jgi:cytochrome c5